MKNSFKFFNNHECEYFPCHKVKDPTKFNCKYCYCPLYLLDCGGNYTMKDGVKSCIDCLIPHQPDSDDYINKILREQVFNK